VAPAAYDLRGNMAISVRRLAGTTDADVAEFCAGLPDVEPVASRLRRYFRSGSVRPAWCFMACAADGRIVGRHWWWSMPGDSVPAGVDLISAEEFSGALELLRHARDELEVVEAICEIGDDDESTDAAPGRAQWPELLRDAGFSHDLARVRVCGDAAPAMPTPDPGAFRPAREQPTVSLVELFQAVADATTDHGMREDRARYGAREEAQRRVDDALRLAEGTDWFSVLVVEGGRPVGYVVPALVDEMAVIAELGVDPAFRRRGYGLELLAYGRHLLGNAGAEKVVADTDRANTAMRHVFRRAGFVETKTYDTYRHVRRTT